MRCCGVFLIRYSSCWTATSCLLSLVSKAAVPRHTGSYEHSAHPEYLRFWDAFESLKSSGLIVQKQFFPGVQMRLFES